AYTSLSQAPAAFGKTAPAAGAVGVNPSAATLTWQPAARATRYEYCVDTTNNNTCDATWNALTPTTVTLSSLGPSTTYFWQVRAVNVVATTSADGGAWWQFTTASAPPVRVNVAAAANGATAIGSSTFSGAFPASGAINGDHKGLGWGTSGAWADG